MKRIGPQLERMTEPAEGEGAVDPFHLLGIEVGTEAFQREFLVRGPDEALARGLLNEELQRWLLDSFAGHGFELSGPDLLVFCARLEPDGLPGLFDLAVKLRRRLEPSGPAPP